MLCPKSRRMRKRVCFRFPVVARSAHAMNRQRKIDEVQIPIDFGRTCASQQG
jgi:hypothetical protein